MAACSVMLSMLDWESEPTTAAASGWSGMEAVVGRGRMGRSWLEEPDRPCSSGPGASGPTLAMLLLAAGHVVLMEVATAYLIYR